MDVCENCGVPIAISKEFNWESNGMISLKSSPRNRVVFYESENIDLLFKGIEELIGLPIEHIVIEGRYRETRRYLERAFPAHVREAIARIATIEDDDSPAITAEEKVALLATIKPIIFSIIELSRVYGYGDEKPSDLWETGGEYPWRELTVQDPYSLLFIAGDSLGSDEACESRSMKVEYKDIGDNTYEIKMSPGEHPVALKERLRGKRYDFKPGDIHWDRCPVCRIPLEVAQHRWDAQKGTIIDASTGRRMAFFGPMTADSIFQDLESELGEAIPETVIEAQRLYIKNAWAGERWNRDRESFRHLIALPGLGNMVGFEGDRTHLSLTIENPSLHLPLVGTVQALVEMAYRIDTSTIEWELAADGDLSVTVIVR